MQSAIAKNGRRSSANRGGFDLNDLTTPQLPEEQTCQAKLRAALFDGVSEQDAKDVVQAIVKAAKSGDAKAQKMFFDYLAGSEPAKPQNVTVNIVADVETAARIAASAKERNRR